MRGGDRLSLKNAGKRSSGSLIFRKNIDNALQIRERMEGKRDTVEINGKLEAKEKRRAVRLYYSSIEKRSPFWPPFFKK